MTKEQLEEIFVQMDKGGYDPSSQEVIMLVEEIDRLRQVLKDIVHPEHDDKYVCSIRCSRCYDPREIAQEALGEE
jgi:hypothetical protein